MGGDLRQRAGPALGGERADRHLVDLVLEDLAVAGMGVAEGVDADAGREIEVPVAVEVLDDRALGPGHGQPGQAGDGLDPRGEAPAHLGDQGPALGPRHLREDLRAFQ